MRYEFQIPGWVVLLKTTKEGALASIGELQTTFVLGVVIAVGLSALLAISQIRKRLVPVEKLQEGTRRIAEKDFKFRVQTHSKDEFDELAASLNSMADQLGRQFRTLTTTSEIDRAVLSLLDTARIIETILSRISQALHCESTSLTLFNADNGQVRQCCLRWEQDFTQYNLTDEFWPAEATKDRYPLAFAVSEAKTVIAASQPQLSYVADGINVPRDGFSSCLGAPLMVKDDVIGVLSFYPRKTLTFTPEEIDFIRQLANQTAIAIYNSQLYERTIHQAAELRQANKAKDEFLSVMSHELRTPLNVIMGYVHVLQDKILGDLTNDQTQALATVEKQSTELLELINSVMDATLIQAGAIVIDSQPVTPAEIFDNVKTQFTALENGAVDIAWECKPNLPTFVSDKSKVERILKIFIDNAIKFTAAGSVSIVAKYSPDPRAVVFAVADTGIGIAQEARERIFEIFRQLDNSGTREYGGLGLGLFIAKQFANQIGAQISVESQVGQGSTFTITVPLDLGANDTVPTSDAILASLSA
jgi:signal transduction histidine kinase/HAMP domain-containing protein